MTVTFGHDHGLRRGQFIATGGLTYRIAEVPSTTTLIVDRPWWLPLHAAWVHVDEFLNRIRRPLDAFWYRLRYGWDDDDH
jgi:hypothetical protein